MNPAMPPTPIEGETLGQYRARLGKPGHDTGAAEAVVWHDKQWTRVSATPVTLDHPDEQRTPAPRKRDETTMHTHAFTFAGNEYRVHHNGDFSGTAFVTRPTEAPTDHRGAEIPGWLARVLVGGRNTPAATARPDLAALTIPCSTCGGSMRIVQAGPRGGYWACGACAGNEAPVASEDVAP